MNRVECNVINVKNVETIEFVKTFNNECQL